MEQERDGSIEALAGGGLVPTPLYKEVKARLTRGLAAGDWKPGAAIPSETRLAERFGVSIGTIRKAIDELYQSRYAITVTRISERISAAHPPPKAAEVLGITTETPALVINRVAYTYGDTPVEYRVSWVDTERHAYLSDLWRNQTVGRA